jgi:hypothetical protein
MGFGYDYITHTVYGSDFELSESVTDPALREQLAKGVEHMNKGNIFNWEHEFRHGANAKHVWTIKKPENA